MKTFLFVIGLAALVACNDSDKSKFTVDGVIKNPPARKVFLEINPSDGSRPMIVDSAVIAADGKYSLTTDNPQESLYSLRLAEGGYPFALLISDTKKMSLNYDASVKTTEAYQIDGSPATKSILELDRELGKQADNIFNLSRHVDSLSKREFTDTTAQKASDSLTNRVFGEYESAVGSLKDYMTKFIDGSGSAVLIQYAIGAYQTVATQVGMTKFTHPELLDILTKASAKFPSVKSLADLKASIAEEKSKMSNRKATEFSMADVNGQQIALSSFRGRYVLLDFWASWCQPCRLDNPNIVRVFNKNKNKNFTILGVSLDKDKNAWLKAIQQDGLTWTHVSDLQYWNNAAAAIYGVQSIPSNFLIDPQGNIVAENLHGLELEAKLKEVLE